MQELKTKETTKEKKSIYIELNYIKTKETTKEFFLYECSVI